MMRISFVCFVLACQGRPSPPKPHAQTISENDLQKVTLSAEAIARLGITEVVVEAKTLPETHVVGGEVVVPSGGALQLTAPVAATVVQRSKSVGSNVKRGDALAVLAPLAPVDRDVQAQAARNASTTESRLQAAEQQLTRVERLLAEGAGSAKLVEQAKADRDVAKADVAAAKQRLSNMNDQPLSADVTVVIRAPHDGVVRQVGVSPSQIVAAGTMLFEVVGSSAFWVRVPLFAPEARRVRQDAAARVSAIGATAPPLDALPAHAPQLADPVTATLDLFYELPAPHDLRPGERVDVELTYLGAASSLTVPASAIVRDATGGAWVYRVLGERLFARQRVEVQRVQGGVAVLSKGTEEGARIVSVGAGELFGVEFGAKH